MALKCEQLPSKSGHVKLCRKNNNQRDKDRKGRVVRMRSANNDDTVSLRWVKTMCVNLGLSYQNDFVPKFRELCWKGNGNGNGDGK